jgi:translation initiation factor 2B subunit (eIF-2B alpha/beta/delta family)
MDAAKKMVASPRLKIRIAPDCAVGTIVKDMHVVLLGADRISATGDISNKIGSLAAACCAKTLGAKIKVVVISDGDKIVAPNSSHGEAERHGPEEMNWAWRDETRRQLEQDKAEVFGEWFEWVPAHLIDAYVTENGILDTEGVGRVGRGVAKLERDIFLCI